LRQCGILGCFAVSEDVRGATCELPSGVGECEPPRRAVDEPRAQPRLDPADGFRDGRLTSTSLAEKTKFLVWLPYDEYEGIDPIDLKSDNHTFRLREHPLS
jgi:hypothetical protein